MGGKKNLVLIESSSALGQNTSLRQQPSSSLKRGVCALASRYMYHISVQGEKKQKKEENL